jgi:hypothetical protein
LIFVDVTLNLRYRYDSHALEDFLTFKTIFFFNFDRRRLLYLLLTTFFFSGFSPHFVDIVAWFCP